MLLRLGLWLITLFCLAGFAELGARGFYGGVPQSPPRPDSVQLPATLIEPDPVLGQRFRANASHFFTSAHGEFAVNYQINEISLREPGMIFPGRPPPHVIVVGDAFAEGWGVMREATFVKELQRQLRQRDDISRYTRVFNAGMTGYGAAQSYLQGRRLLEQIGADVVVFLYTGLMPVMDYRFLKTARTDQQGIVERAGATSLQSQAVAAPAGASAFVNWLSASYGAMQARERIRFGDPESDLFAAAREPAVNVTALHRRSLDHALALNRIAAKQGARFLFVHIPLAHQVSSDEWRIGRQTFGFDNKRYSIPESELLQSYCDSEFEACLLMAQTLSELSARFSGAVYFQHDYALNEHGHRALVNEMIGPVHTALAGRGQPERYIIGTRKN